MFFFFSIIYAKERTCEINNLIRGYTYKNGDLTATTSLRVNFAQWNSLSSFPFIFAVHEKDYLSKVRQRVTEPGSFNEDRRREQGPRTVSSAEHGKVRSAGPEVARTVGKGEGKFYNTSGRSSRAWVVDGTYYTCGYGNRLYESQQGP